MIRFIWTIIFYLFVYSCGLTFAQDKATKPGSVILGKIKDTTLNYNIEGASIAIYNLQDTSLILSGLTSRSGNFRLRTELLNVKLLIVFSYLGYANFSRLIAISSNHKEFDLGIIPFSKKSIQLDAIDVGVPPVRMNRDTIEFFADAYDLKPSATVDDLIRKFPGLVVWGDGSITYNGKNVPSVKVNGKDFLGGNIKLATHNLPKDAVQKVQLYNKYQSVSSRDTSYEMNVKLKESKNNGFFGKITYGRGSKRHYGGDIALNYFNEKVQMSTAYATNNTNKVVNSVDGLLLNTTFKSNTNKSDYEPDFNRKGTNDYKAGGYLLSYDLLKNKRYPTDEHVIKSNLFFRKNKTQIKDFIKQEYLQGIDLGIIREDNNTDLLNESTGKFDVSYKRVSNEQAINIDLQTSFTDNSNEKSHNRNTSEDGSVNSRSLFESNGNNKHTNYSISGNYHKNAIYEHKILLPTFNIGTHLTQNNTSFKGNKKTHYISLLSPKESKEYDRNYDNSTKKNSKSISFASMPLGRLLLGQKLSSGINIHLKGDVLHEIRNNNDIVYDSDTSTRSLIKNNTLSNSAEFSLLNKALAFNVSRGFDLGSLTDRYEKRLTINSVLTGRAINQKNESSIHAFQNISRSYHAFLPELSVVFNNSAINRGTNRYTLQYRKELSIPGIDQIVPIVDSINIYDIYVGNLRLKEAIGHRISMMYSYDPSSTKKGYQIKANLNYHTSKDYMGTVTMTNGDGLRSIFNENMAGYDSYTLGLSLLRAFKSKNEHTFLVSLDFGGNIADIPFHINSQKYSSESKSFTSRISINYSFKDIWFLDYSSALNEYIYTTKDGGYIKSNNRNSTLSLSNRINISWNIYDILTFNSNLKNDINSSSSGFKNNYYLWNVSLSKRFRPEKDIEVNFGAYDILKQNKNIFFNSDPTMLMYSQHNAISSYFFLSLAYYPRYFFGNKK